MSPYDTLWDYSTYLFYWAQGPARIGMWYRSMDAFKGAVVKNPNIGEVAVLNGDTTSTHQPPRETHCRWTMCHNPWCTCCYPQEDQ